MTSAGWAIKAFLFIFLINNSLFAENRLFDHDIKITASDETGVTFTYLAPPASLKSIDGYPASYKYPGMPYTVQNRLADKPLLPVKVVPLGVPFDVQPQVEIISSDYISLGKVKVPVFIDAPTIGEFKAKVASLGAVPDWPPYIAKISRRRMIRGMRIAKINLAAAKASGLKIKTSVLKLAKRVIQKEKPKNS